MDQEDTGQGTVCSQKTAKANEAGSRWGGEEKEMGDGGKSTTCFGVHRIPVATVWCRDHGEWASGPYLVASLSPGPAQVQQTRLPLELNKALGSLP